MSQTLGKEIIYPKNNNDNSNKLKVEGCKLFV